MYSYKNYRNNLKEQFFAMATPYALSVVNDNHNHHDYGMGSYCHLWRQDNSIQWSWDSWLGNAE